eukprot:14873183-Alexandrium_andersonii.AAC.1
MQQPARRGDAAVTSSAASTTRHVHALLNQLTCPNSKHGAPRPNDILTQGAVAHTTGAQA